VPSGRAYRYNVKFLRGHGGQSLIELALALPILVFLLMGGLDFARVLSAQVGVLNAARVGAEAGASRATGVAQPVGANDAAVIAYSRTELGRVPGVDPANATITVTATRADNSSACLNPPTTATPCYITVRVRYPFQTAIAWPFLPNAIALDESVQFRSYP
jgi:Flp pilus assembly protein TadG